MAKALPPLTWFRAFEATARLRSFTRAADELGFTQSAISQHVRALEDRLGSQLFVRGPRSLQLTQAGRLLVPDVTAALAQLGRATQRFVPIQGKDRLTIATSASIAQWILAPQLCAFQKAHPNIAVQIATTNWPDDFTTTKADIEIRFGMADVVGHNATLLTPSTLHAVVAPALVAAMPTGGTLPDMAHVPLIQPVGLSQDWAALGASASPSLALEPAFYVDTHGLGVDLAVAGAGVALAHAQITRQPIALGQLVVLPIAPIVADEGYYLAAQPTYLPEAQAAFIAWFRQIAPQ